MQSCIGQGTNHRYFASWKSVLTIRPARSVLCTGFVFQGDGNGFPEARRCHGAVQIDNKVGTRLRVKN